MSAVLTPRQTEQGWVVEMTPEMISSLGVAAGSRILLTMCDGSVGVEILPPLAPDLQEFIRGFCEKNKEAFEELKRLGD
jgi:hypothetical protein